MDVVVVVEDEGEDNEDRDTQISSNCSSDNQLFIGISSATTAAVNFPNLNPLNIPTIVREVLQYLKPSELQSPRLVNSTWSGEANHFIAKIPKVFQSSYPPLLADFVLDTVLNPNLPKIFKSFTFINSNPESREWRVFATLFGPHLETLNISTSQILIHVYDWVYLVGNSAHVYNFVDLLKSFPLLTTLTLRLCKSKWQRPGCQRQTQTPQTQLSLPALKNLTINTRIRHMTQPVSLNDWDADDDWVVGTKDWDQDEIWTILKLIVQAAPNLKFLKTEMFVGKYLPGHFVQDIFTDPASASACSFRALDTLILGDFGPIPAPPPGEYVSTSRWSPFFNILSRCPGISSLTRLTLPRPSHATPADWNNLFSCVSSTLVHLDLSQVDVVGFEEDCEPLAQISFQIPMPNLRCLTLDVSMLPLTTARGDDNRGRLLSNPNPNTLPIFPALDELTVYIYNELNNSELLEQMFAYYRDDGVDIDLKIFGQVRKLVLILTLAKSNPTLRHVFEALATQLPNVSHLEVKNVSGCQVLPDLFGAYRLHVHRPDGSGGIWSSVAENIRILSLKGLSGYDGIPNWERPLELTGEIDLEQVEPSSAVLVQEPMAPTLKIFKNLKKFVLGFEDSRDSFRISPHFARTIVSHLPNLESLELYNSMIDRRAEAELTALTDPDSGRLSNFKTYDCEVYD